MKIGGGETALRIFESTGSAYENCPLIKCNLGWSNHIDGKFIFQVALRSIFVKSYPGVGLERFRLNLYSSESQLPRGLPALKDIFTLMHPTNKGEMFARE
jgi:hypothetical protein